MQLAQWFQLRWGECRVRLAPQLYSLRARASVVESNPRRAPVHSHHRDRMSSQLEFKPLHDLYQVLESAGSADLDHPLVCVAQVQRRPPSSRSSSPDPLNLGDIEWVVAIGAQAPSTSAPATKRRRKQGPTDVWWEARLCGREVDDLFQQVRPPLFEFCTSSS